RTYRPARARRVRPWRAGRAGDRRRGVPAVPAWLRSRVVATATQPRSAHHADVFPGDDDLVGAGGGPVVRGRGGKREQEFAAPARRRVRPDPPAVAFDDLPADREADPGARVALAGMRPLKDHEDPLVVLGVDAEAVV